MANQKEEFYTRRSKNILLHPGQQPEDVPALQMDGNNASLEDPTGKNSIMVTRNAGIGIMGPVSIMASPFETRMHGLWKINPLVMTSIPSTLYTPQPWLRQSVPQAPKEMIQGIVKIAGLLAGLG